MISDLIAIITLVVVIFYQGYLIYDIRKQYEARISNLLDRIMANEYPTYIQGEVAKEQVKQEPVFEEERGISI